MVCSKYLKSKEQQRPPLPAPPCSAPDPQPRADERRPQLMRGPLCPLDEADVQAAGKIEMGQGEGRIVHGAPFRFAESNTGHECWCGVCAYYLSLLVFFLPSPYPAFRIKVVHLGYV